MRGLARLVPCEMMEDEGLEVRREGSGLMGRVRPLSQAKEPGGQR